MKVSRAVYGNVFGLNTLGRCQINQQVSVDMGSGNYISTGCLFNINNYSHANKEKPRCYLRQESRQFSKWQRAADYLGDCVITVRHRGTSN